MLIDSSRIHFDAEKHLYTVKDTGQVLLSASQLINLYKKPFDADGSILRRSAAKKGIPPEELKKQWKQAAVDGTTKGSSFHKSVEHYINTGEILKDENKDLVREFKKIKFRGKLHSETLLFDEDLGIAGTCDLLEVFNDETANLLDFKTNKTLSDFCPFGNRMLYPVDHLYQSSVTVYSIQLSIYSYLLEETFGFWINSLTLLWVNLKTRKIKKIEVPNRRKEVEKILKHYRQNYAYLPIDQLIRKE